METMRPMSCESRTLNGPVVPLGAFWFGELPTLASKEGKIYFPLPS